MFFIAGPLSLMSWPRRTILAPQSVAETAVFLDSIVVRYIKIDWQRLKYAKT